MQKEQALVVMVAIILMERHLVAKMAVKS